VYIAWYASLVGMVGIHLPVYVPPYHPGYTPYIHPVLHQRVYTTGYVRVCGSEALGSNLGLIREDEANRALQPPKV